MQGCWQASQAMFKIVRAVTVVAGRSSDATADGGELIGRCEAVRMSSDVLLDASGLRYLCEPLLTSLSFEKASEHVGRTMHHKAFARGSFAVQAQRAARADVHARRMAMEEQNAKAGDKIRRIEKREQQADWRAAHSAQLVTKLSETAMAVQLLCDEQLPRPEARDVSKLLHSMIDTAAAHHAALGEAEEEHERDWCARQSHSAVTSQNAKIYSLTRRRKSPHAHAHSTHTP